MSTLTYTGELTVVTCWCGMRHGVPSELREFQLREHRDGRIYSVYCPLGHNYHPGGESDAAKLRRQLEQAQRREANLRDDLNVEVASHRATKGQVTKLRKRVANGVCPCCSRTFANLQRHMASQHPDFAEPSA